MVSKKITSFGLAALIAGLTACSSDIPTEPSTPSEPWTQAEPVTQVAKPTIAEPIPTPIGTTYDRISTITGEELDSTSEQSARRIVENIQSISGSADKQEFLYATLESQLKDKYSRSSIPKLFGFVDDHKEGALLASLLQAAERVRSRVDDSYFLPDAFLFAGLNNEGHIFDTYSNHGTVPGLNGFSIGGLDWFGGEYSHIRDAGFLSGDFESKFTVSYTTNEKGESVPTANFNNVDAVFEAFAATMLYRQHRFLKDIQNEGIGQDDISREEILFWTYFYFNGGEGKGRRVIRKHDSLEEMKDFYKNSSGVSGVSGNCKVVLSSQEWLERSGSFDLSPEGTYWWSGGVGVPKTSESFGELSYTAKPVDYDTSTSTGSGDSGIENSLFTFIKAKNGDGKAVFRFEGDKEGLASEVSLMFNEWDVAWNNDLCASTNVLTVNYAGHEIDSSINGEKKVYVTAFCED